MGKKLYVGNIPFQATEEQLMTLFSEKGAVSSVKSIINMQTGQPRGFAFIEMKEETAADKAIAELNGTSFMDRNIIVNVARPQKPRSGGYDKNRGGGYKRGPGGTRGPGGAGRARH